MITVYELCTNIYYTNSCWYYTQSHNTRTIMQATQQNWVGSNKKPWKTSRYRDMLIYTDSTKKKVDGRNPAPPGMYKNPVNNGINYQPHLVSRISSIHSMSATGLTCLPHECSLRPVSPGPHASKNGYGLGAKGGNRREPHYWESSSK